MAKYSQNASWIHQLLRASPAWSRRSLWGCAIVAWVLWAAPGVWAKGALKREDLWALKPIAHPPIPEAEGKYLRVVLLEDGETVHNAFFDRRFEA